MVDMYWELNNNNNLNNSLSFGYTDLSKPKSFLFQLIA